MLNNIGLPGLILLLPLLMNVPAVVLISGLSLIGLILFVPAIFFGTNFVVPY